MIKTRKGKRNGDVKSEKPKQQMTMFKKRLIVTGFIVALAVLGGVITVIVSQRIRAANTSYDPYLTLNSGPPKVRIYEPIGKTVENSVSQTVKGIAPPNTSVTVKLDNVTAGTATANDLGSWSTTLTNIPDGDHSLSASTTVAGPIAIAQKDVDSVAGYSVLDLTTNGLLQSTQPGLGFFLNGNDSSTLDTSDHKILVTPDHTKAYLVRQRSVAVIDLTTPDYKVTKNIDLVPVLGDNTALNYSAAILSPDGSRLYGLFGADGSIASTIISINTATDSLVQSGGFPASLTTQAKQLEITADGAKLFALGAGVNDETSGRTLSIINTADGTVVQQDLPNRAHDMAYDASNSRLYISMDTSDDGSSYIGVYDIAAGGFNDKAILIGSSNTPGNLYYLPQIHKLYAASNNSLTDLFAVDTSDGTVTGPFTMPGSMNSDDSTVTNFATNSDSSRLFFNYFADGLSPRVAVWNTQTDSLIGNIEPPTASQRQAQSVMFYNNKLFIGYQRQASEPDLLNNFPKIYNSIGVADATASGTTTAAEINGGATGINGFSEPIPITPKILTTSIAFSVGTSISITSPTSAGALTTSTPLIKGKGPKSALIDLKVNGGNSIPVQVDSDGLWQAQVSLTKGQNNTVSAIYKNVHSQLVIPVINPGDRGLGKAELSVIDGENSLQTKPIPLATLGAGNVNFNTSAAINPNGLKYYVVNNTFNSFVGVITGLLASQLPDTASTLEQLMASNLGSIDVYNSQTQQKTSQISLPDGVLPQGLTISPNGKIAYFWAPNLAGIQAFSAAKSPTTESIGRLVDVWQVDLENNTVAQAPIDTGSQSVPGDNDPETTDLLLALDSSASYLFKTGSFNDDGSKFYTSGLTASTVGVVNTANGTFSRIALPSDQSHSLVLSTTYNKGNKMLYASTLQLTPADNSSPASITPNLVVFNTSTNLFVGSSLLPEVPIGSFAVDATGSKLYMSTTNAADFTSALTSGNQSPSELLTQPLSRFNLGVYDVGVGTYTQYPLGYSELPLNLALSKDSSKLFIPTFGQNIVHVFDTQTNQLDTGNAPIILNGVNSLLSSTDYVGEAILGTYNADATYYVPADAPATTVVTPPVVKTTAAINQFTFLQASSPQVAGAKETIYLPQKTKETLRETVQKITSYVKAPVTLKTWLAYAFYGAFLAFLIATGVTVWKTDIIMQDTESSLDY